jgi:hypothetical protein
MADDVIDHLQVFVTLRDERRQRAQKLIERRKAEFDAFQE